MSKVTLESIYDLVNDYTVMSDQKFTNLENSIKNIRENHLVHLKNDIESLTISEAVNVTEHKNIIERISGIDTRQWWAVALVIATLLGVVVNTYLTLK